MAKSIQKRFTLLDRVLLEAYKQVFWPNNLVFIFLFLFVCYLEMGTWKTHGLAGFSSNVFWDMVGLFAFLNLFLLGYLGILHMLGFYKKLEGDKVTFSGSYYTVKNPTREFKFYWKEVRYCFVSGSQIFINNGNSILYRISNGGLTEREWDFVQKTVKSKVKTTPLAPITWGIVITNFLGILWLLLLFGRIVAHLLWGLMGIQ